MAEPLNLECSLDLARQWPRLLAAAGVSVRTDPGGLSGTAEDHGRPTRVQFREYNADLVARYHDDEVLSRLREEKAGMCCCRLSDIREPVASVLAKSFLASGARCSYEPLGLLDTAALVSFGRASELADWAGALEGVADFQVEGVLRRPGSPELPFGRVDAGPAPVRFTTGPACLGADLLPQVYLELRLDRESDWRHQGVRNFVHEVVERLASCGGSAIVLWGKLLPHGRMR